MTPGRVRHRRVSGDAPAVALQGVAHFGGGGLIAPVVLGAGKRLFEGFTQSLDLEHLGIRQSQYATFTDYRVKK